MRIVGWLKVMRFPLGLLVVFVGACHSEPPPHPATPTAAPEPQTAAPEPVPPDPTDPVSVFENGASRIMDRADAERAGFTVLDLGDEWTPYVLSECEADGSVCKVNEYKPTYLALANERPVPEGAHDIRGGKFLELYGIAPTPRVIRQRILDDEAKSCWANVKYDALRAFDGFMTWTPGSEGDATMKAFRAIDTDARRAAEREGLSDPSELENVPGRRPLFERWSRTRTRYMALVEAQRRLSCEGLYPPNVRIREGVFDWATHESLALFERKNRVFGWGFIGRETIDVLRKTPIENHYDAFLRIAEERAASAAGFVEDGTAKDAPGAPETYRTADGRTEQLRDLLAESRAAIVQALGIPTPQALRDFLVSRSEEDVAHLLVAVKLPDLPAYYGPDMDLHVLVDRGDVWYDFPYDEEGNEIPQAVIRRPHETLFVRYEGQDIPLGYWGSTIGGWRSELVDGYEYYSYKNSDVGERVWREVVAAPVWIPPDSTPTRDLLRREGGPGQRARTVPNYPEFGPGYASAYGLVMAPHVREIVRADGTILPIDNGIRTHGSFDYMSIMQRHSHGCHRLYNHIAIRLFGFILRHRAHERIGQVPVNYSRRFEVDGEDYEIVLGTRGYSFRLQEAIPVVVTRGRVRGVARDPIETPMRKHDVDYGDDAGVPDAGIPIVDPASIATTAAPAPVP
jgi:hypothetical protein